MADTVNVVECFLDPKDFHRPSTRIVKENVSILEAMLFVEKHPNTNNRSYTIHRSGKLVPDANTLYEASRVA